MDPKQNVQTIMSIRNVISNFGEFHHTSYTSMIYIEIFRGLLDPLAKRAGNSVKQAVTLLILNHLKAFGFPVKFTPIHGKAFLIPILKEENTNEHSTQAHLFGVESSRRTACIVFSTPPRGITHSIHVCYIYIHLPETSTKCR